MNAARTAATPIRSCSNRIWPAVKIVVKCQLPLQQFQITEDEAFLLVARPRSMRNF